MIKTNLSRREMILGSALALASTGLLPTAANAHTEASNYGTETLAICHFSQEISKLAVNKAVHPKVQRFAKLEAAETEAVVTLLLGAGLMKPDLREKLADTLADMKKMDPGTKFDLDFIKNQIDGHEALMDIQKQRVEDGESGIDLTVASMLVPFTETHLLMLQDVRNSVAT